MISCQIVTQIIHHRKYRFNRTDTDQYRHRHRREVRYRFRFLQKLVPTPELENPRREYLHKGEEEIPPLSPLSP